MHRRAGCPQPAAFNDMHPFTTAGHSRVASLALTGNSPPEGTPPYEIDLEWEKKYNGNDNLYLYRQHLPFPDGGGLIPRT